MILVIDNYDSFVHNLARHMKLAAWECEIFRNDAITLEQVEELAPEAIVISPGPYAPPQAGICVDVIRRMGPTTPILGICLGHQCIAAAYGAKTVAGNPMHGKASDIRHNGDALFAGVPEVFAGGRYHSLKVELNHSPPYPPARGGESGQRVPPFTGGSGGRARICAFLQ